MKILQLCPKPLFSPLDGGKIAMLATAEGLMKAGQDVQQWVISSPAHPFPEKIPTGYPFQVVKTQVDTRIKPFSALGNLLLSGASYNMIRFKTDGVATGLEKILKKQEFDVIQAESIYSLAHLGIIRRYSKAKIILRAHNVEHRIWERRAFNSENPLKKVYFGAMAKRLKKEEIAIWNSVDGIAAMSEVDAEMLKNEGVRTPIAVIGIGTDLRAPSETTDQVSVNQLFHLGAMNWGPNAEGIRWFIDKVWPAVLKSFPTMKLVLAGRDMPEEFTRMTGSHILVKDAEDAAQFMLNEGIMIVPLFSGSGIRVKIIEGMALGKLIISTPLGAEGLRAEDGEHLLIASTPEAFVRKIRMLHDESGLAARISENARTFATSNFSNEKLTLRLLDFYNTLLHN